MARLLAESLELQDVASGYYFEIRAGGLDDVPSVRGSDTIIPGKAGREFRDRVADLMPVTLHGIVFGAASGADSAEESYRLRAAALKAVFDPTADPFPITIHAPLEGLPSGTATLNVRFLRFVVGHQGAYFRIMDIECECIDSPPEWVVEGS
jgi:hypothetical protein